MTQYFRLRKPPDGVGNDRDVCVECIAVLTRSERSRLKHLAEERCEGRTVGRTLYLFRSRTAAESFLRLAESHLEELSFMEFKEFSDDQTTEFGPVRVENQPIDGRANQWVVYQRLVVFVGATGLIAFSGFAWISLRGTPNVTVTEAAKTIATSPTTELELRPDEFRKKEETTTVQSEALQQSDPTPSPANQSEQRPPAVVSSEFPTAANVEEKFEVPTPELRTPTSGWGTLQSPVTLTGAIFVTDIVYHRRSDCPAIGPTGTWRPESHSNRLYACPICYPRKFDDE